MNRREILFRGKRVDNGGWVYGSLLNNRTAMEGSAYIIPFFVDSSNFDYIEVYPHTIGQFTGLTDSKGNKVFEGDIVIDEAFNKGVVVWLTDAAQFLCDFGMDYHDIGTWATVIGNQFDTPELIQQS